MSASALIFFFIFSLIIIGMYVAVRRMWFDSTVTVAIGIISSTIAMTMMLRQMNDNVGDAQAIFFGFLIGGAFSLISLLVAWYFHSNEVRDGYANDYGDEG